MFKSKNKIIPEETLDGNDPIQARIHENILNIKSKLTKNTKRNNKIKPTKNTKTNKKLNR